MDYTDDLILLAASKDKFRRASGRLNRIMEVFGVSISESEVCAVVIQE